MKRAVIYARFSTQMQREESIEAQVRACSYYAQKFDYDVTGIYADRGKSGKSSKNRDEFQKLLADSKNGEFDAVLVHRLNRFGRDALETLELERELSGQGIELTSVTEKLDRTPEGRLMLYIIAGMNEFYSANLALETMKGLKENAYKGKTTGGTPPLGYCFDADGMLQIVEQEAIAVRTIFDLYVQGYGYGYIVDELNSRGFFTKRGQPFCRNSLHDILKNEKYAGVFTYNKTESVTKDGKYNRHKNKSDYIRVDGGCPAIVDKITFDTVQKKMMANRRHGGRNLAKTVYILTGKLRCGRCGALLVGLTRKAKGINYSYYICNYKQRSHQCDMPTLHKDVAEKQVIDYITKVLFSDEQIRLIAELMTASYEATDSDAELARITKAQAINQRKISNLIKAIADGVDAKELTDELAQLKRDKAKLDTKYLALRTAPDAKLPYDELVVLLRKALDLKNLSPVQQQAVVQILVNKVVVNVNPNDPEKIELDIIINPNNANFEAANALFDEVQSPSPLPL